jgi:hypothetical protein
MAISVGGDYLELCAAGMHEGLSVNKHFQRDVRAGRPGGPTARSLQCLRGAQAPRTLRLLRTTVPAPKTQVLEHRDHGWCYCGKA